MPYCPPFTISSKAVNLVSEIIIKLTSIQMEGRTPSPKLRRVCRMKSINSSLAIENNTLSMEQVTDVIDGKRVLGNPREIQEVRNAFECYDLIPSTDPYSIDDLLKIHGIMMRYLVDDAGKFRSSGVGIFSEEWLVHMAPPANLVPELIGDLFRWLAESDDHPLIKGCVFHYEFEFIHPFSDGNGRTGRLWHTLILSKWADALAWVPVESVIKERQNEYYEAIGRSTSLGDSGPFIDFMLEALRDAMDNMPHTIEHMDGLTRTEVAVFNMIRDGMFVTIDAAAEDLDVSARTVSRALASLKEKGLIVRTGSDRKGSWKVARGRLPHDGRRHHPPRLIHTVSEVHGGQQSLEGVGTHVLLDHVPARPPMTPADPHDPVYVRAVGQHPLGDHVIGDLVLLEVRHGTLSEGGVPVDLLAHDELQHRVPQELQPLVAVPAALVGIAVVRQGRAEQCQTIRGDVPVAERRTCQELADLHLETRLHCTDPLRRDDARPCSSTCARDARRGSFITGKG